MDSVSIIIPAYNEEKRIERTLQSLLRSGQWYREIIVVDDGSVDNTYLLAQKWTPHVLRMEHNYGKAKALRQGCAQAKGEILLFLDADLEESAPLARSLLAPILQNKADMTIAIFPPSQASGFGVVKRFAGWGIRQKTGKLLQAPLSGQRAIRKQVFQACYQGDRGFGIEVGLTIDLLLAGYQLAEIEIPFSHRETGKSWSGFAHRIRQGLAVSKALLARR